MEKDRGFTFIELLAVMAIIGVLASIVISSLHKGKEKSYLARSGIETKSLLQALEFYYEDNGTYPPDVSRDIPPGIGQYLSGEQANLWPKAPWEGSVYDWDNWADPDNPGERIYQISIRFCPIGGPLSACNFPDESWASNFGVNSSAYYCVAGNCRAHIGEPVDYPGYCLNC